jgi:hypothetical protein
MRLLPAPLFWGFCSLFGLGLFSARAAFTVDLEDVGLSPGVAYAGADGAGGFGSGGVHFGNRYDSAFGVWSGFAVSAVNDPDTAGFGNQFASAAGPGEGGSLTYAVGFDDTFGEEADVVTLPVPSAVAGLYANNTAYTALSMLHGDAFAKQFGGPDGTDPDYLLLTISGRDLEGGELGSVDLYLADYRAEDPALDSILTAWTWVDLSPLGDAVHTLHFSLASSDVGPFGMNTPAYFAIDSLVVVPEPSAGVLALVGFGLLMWRRRGGGGAGHGGR